jgi:hypothetical protein
VRQSGATIHWNLLYRRWSVMLARQLRALPKQQHQQQQQKSGVVDMPIDISTIHTNDDNNDNINNDDDDDVVIIGSSTSDKNEINDDDSGEDILIMLSQTPPPTQTLYSAGSTIANITPIETTTTNVIDKQSDTQPKHSSQPIIQAICSMFCDVWMVASNSTRKHTEFVVLSINTVC